MTNLGPYNQEIDAPRPAARVPIREDAGRRYQSLRRLENTIDGSGEVAVHESAADELMAAVRSGDIDGIQHILHRNPALADGLDDRPAPLTVAAYIGRRDVADLLIFLGATVDIFQAAALDLTDRIAALLDDEPDLIAAYSADGWTPLHLAAHFGNIQAGTLLLARGSLVHARSRSPEGNTPLHAAVAGRQPAFVDLLLERGADVDAADADGWTAINIAAHEGDIAIVASLIRAGADLTIPSNSGLTPAETAVRDGHPELLPLLSGDG